MNAPERRRATPRKSERTRARILDAALELFRTRGYEAATMRAIARAAGVSLGAAYYYFESKEHLIQGFYARMNAEHVAACEALLASEKDLARRLEGVLLAKIDTAEPYHRVAGVLFRTAADPKSPLNPFSAASSEVRGEGAELMRRVVEGAAGRRPADLAEKLPELLWLYEMSVILFWLHDESQDRRRTRRLIARTVEVVTRLISVASLAPLRPLRAGVLELVDELRSEPPDA